MNPGTAYITFTGCGTYAGDLTVPFDIVKSENSSGGSDIGGGSGSGGDTPGGTRMLQAGTL